MRFFHIALRMIDLFTNNRCSQMKVISVLIFYDLNQFSFTNPINSLINLLQNKGMDRILVSIKTTRIKYFFMRSRNNIQNMQLKLYVYNMYIQFSQRFFLSHRTIYPSVHTLRCRETSNPLTNLISSSQTWKKNHRI